jgi:hypothetical protein
VRDKRVAKHPIKKKWATVELVRLAQRLDKYEMTK